MKLEFCLGLIASALLPAAATAQSAPVHCVHTRGERMFLGATRVSIERTGSQVTVRPLGVQKAAPDDYWTYTIVFEGPQQSYRAIRASLVEGTSTTLNVSFGGELFYFYRGGARVVVATAINAPALQNAMAELAC